MNLFRSEEHVRNWSGYKKGTKDGIVSLSDMARLFSGDFFKKRLESDYVSNMRGYMGAMVGSFQSMGSFWQVK
ncbi:hypothetical protein ACFL2O_03080 [Thermodesulfobacteriota bacterium]